MEIFKQIWDRIIEFLGLRDGVLSGNKILSEHKKDTIKIEPFKEERVNPNSYDLTLGDTLLVYKQEQKRLCSSCEGFGHTIEEGYSAEINDRTMIMESNKTVECTKCNGGGFLYESYLDPKEKNDTREIEIPEDGIILEPGEFYLGVTKERTSTDKYIPMIEGKSSIARLGIEVHRTAGFGDIGFDGQWTLEITAEEPVKIYPGMEICQIYYHTIVGSYKTYSSDKYQGNSGVQASKYHMNYNDNGDG